MTTEVPISTLDPSAPPPQNTNIRAHVTLLWPYSSSTLRCTLLLTDLDARQRYKRGQIRVRFSGPAGQAIAKSGVGIGDEVVLWLEGARWEEDEGTVKTPGKSVEGVLRFGRKLRLEIVRDERKFVTVDASEEEESRQTEVGLGDRASSGLEGGANALQTPVRPSPGTRPRFGFETGGVAIYSSPAFSKRLRLSQGSFEDSSYMPELDDDEADPAHERKRRRVSYKNVTEWRYTERSVSPEKQGKQGVEERESGREDQEGEKERTRAVTPDASARMLPPPLPRLQTPSGKNNAKDDDDDHPKTPHLQPVSSATLPLPSPFPDDAQQKHYFHHDVHANSLASADGHLSAGLVPSQPSPLAAKSAAPDTIVFERALPDSSGEAPISSDELTASQQPIADPQSLLVDKDAHEPELEPLERPSTELSPTPGSEADIEDTLYDEDEITRLQEEDSEEEDGQESLAQVDFSRPDLREEVSDEELEMHESMNLADEDEDGEDVDMIDESESEVPESMSEKPSDDEDGNLSSDEEEPVEVDSDGEPILDKRVPDPEAAMILVDESEEEDEGEPDEESEDERLATQLYDELREDSESPRKNHNFGLDGSSVSQPAAPRQTAAIASDTKPLSPVKEDTGASDDDAWNMREDALHTMTEEQVEAALHQHKPSMSASEDPVRRASRSSVSAAPLSSVVQPRAVEAELAAIDSKPVDEESSTVSQAEREYTELAPETTGFDPAESQEEELASQADPDDAVVYSFDAKLDVTPVARSAVPQQALQAAGAILDTLEPSPPKQSAEESARPEEAQEESEEAEEASNLAQAASMVIARAIEDADMTRPHLDDGSTADAEASVAFGSQILDTIPQRPPKAGEEDRPGSDVAAQEERSGDSEAAISRESTSKLSSQRPTSSQREENNFWNDLYKGTAPEDAQFTDSILQATSAEGRASDADGDVPSSEKESGRNLSGSNEVAQPEKVLPPQTALAGAATNKVGAFGSNLELVDPELLALGETAQSPRPEAADHQTRNHSTGAQNDFDEGQTILYPNLPLSPETSQVASFRSEVSRIEHGTQTEGEVNARLPPTPRFTQTTSSNLTVKDIPQTRTAETQTPEGKVMPTSRRSASGRSGDVPEVIKEWYAPRRSSARFAATEEEAPAKDVGTNGHAATSPSSQHRRTSLERAITPQGLPQDLSQGLSTPLAYFHSLTTLSSQLNQPSATVDVLAVIASATTDPQRAKAGPKDFYTIFHVTDPALYTLEEDRISTLDAIGDHGHGHGTAKRRDIRVEVFRPWKASLPTATEGAVVLLRAFAVKSRNHRPYLLSCDASAWCVWRFGDGEAKVGAVREEVKGPPVDIGDEERERVGALREWWRAVRDAAVVEE